MTPERWSRIQSVFEAALDLPADERPAFLESVCAGDDDLRREVTSLLDAFSETGPVDVLAGELAGSFASIVHAGPGRAGRRIGPYRILREIGRGGMGAVYLAERADEQFQQRVALKLAQQGLASEMLQRRFLLERQILARLQHPNIARLYDGGLTDERLPYFAMEYVEGRPIDRYCDDQQLSVTERLRLFKAVCQAVQYAHQNLVVHRDLKPSNMLVTEDGTVKLLDFGIAKLLEERGDEALTQTGLPVMTPEYAAPEQVCGEPVTTATDVYSLGIVLYELLSGHRPYRVKALSPSEVERVICETMPPRPSTAVTQGIGGAEADEGHPSRTPEAVSAARATTTERLQRRLVGDLDMIVLKALAKEPERRYDSAGALLEDINRHLAGWPVQAQGATVGYRVRKFVRRHRWGVAVAAAFVVLLAATAALLAVQQAETARERDRARLEAAKAQEVAAFLVTLFKEADPAQARGDTMTVFDLLARGTERVGQELADQPELQGTMMHALGQVYRDMGQFDQARPLLEDALAIRRDALGDTHPDVAASMTSLGVLAHHQGAYASADSLYRAALQIRLRGQGEVHEDVAAIYNNLGALHHQQGRLDEAENYYRKAIDLRERLGEGETLDLATNMAGLAILLKNKGALGAADSLQRKALTIFRAHLEDDHPALANELNNRGTLLVALGDLDGAEAALRQALAMWRTVYQDGHPRVAQALNNLAAVLERKGRFDEAVPLYRESYELKRVLIGEEHPSTVASLSNLGLVLWKQGDLPAAEQTLHDALDLHRRVHGEEHPRTALAVSSLANVQCEQGAFRTGEDVLYRALEVMQQAHPDGHWQVARVQSALGGCLTVLGRYEEAEVLLLEAYPLLRGELGEEHERTRRARRRLASLYEQLGDAAAARRYRAPGASSQ